MTPFDEKKTLPPAEVLPGGVFPDEIAAIKKKAQEGTVLRLKIAIAVGSLLLVTLMVVGGTFLGLHLNHKPTTLKRSVQLAIENELVEETVEVDKEKNTETFRTVSSTGISFVIRDMKKGLSAYKFGGDEKCYIFESLEDTEGIDELFEDMKQIGEGRVVVAKRRTDTFLSVDEERGQVERSVLSESMLEFCEGLETHWAVKSSLEPTPTASSGYTSAKPTPIPDGEAPTALPGTNATDVVHQREKRSGCSCCRRCEGYCRCVSRSTESCVRVTRRRCARWGWLFRSGRCLDWVSGCEYRCSTVHIRICECHWYK
ncbi:uncharacterized protein LOC144874048 [Branchiostoma floridae x Branchiostoma japonicum]